MCALGVVMAVRATLPQALTLEGGGAAPGQAGCSGATVLSLTQSVEQGGCRSCRSGDLENVLVAGAGSVSRVRRSALLLGPHAGYAGAQSSG